MILVVLFLLCPLLLLGQCSTAWITKACETLLAQAAEEVLTAEERLQNILALHHIQPVETIKADYSLELNPQPLPDFQLRTVLSDEPLQPKAHLVTWSDIPSTAPIPMAVCPGVCVSYSAQGAEGLRASTGKRVKGVQLVAAQICADRAVTLGAGRVLAEAGALGYQWHAPLIGTAIVERTVGLNWRAITINTVKYGSIFVLNLAIPGAIRLTLSTKAVLAAVHSASDDLPLLFAPGAPNPEPYLKTLIDPNGSLSLGPDRCQIVTFSAVYPGGPRTTGAIQLMP